MIGGFPKKWEPPPPIAIGTEVTLTEVLGERLKGKVIAHVTDEEGLMYDVELLEDHPRARGWKKGSTMTLHRYEFNV